MREEKIYFTDDGEQFLDLEEATRHEKICELKIQQNDLRNQIVKLQEECEHHHMTVQAHSDTGNYCKSDDLYWYEGTCRTCGQRWNVDQSENSIVRERYRSNDKKVIIQK